MNATTFGRTIVSAEYGSRLTGVATADSDHDVMSVYVEAPEYVLGIEHAGTGVARSGPDLGDSVPMSAQQPRSTPADTDEVIYPLKKWAELAAAGNPTVLSLLFTPPEFHELIDPLWTEHVLAKRDAFVSKDAVRKFMGYSFGQRQALMGQRNKRTNRPELVHEHGYDTKFAYHMVRTLLQGYNLALRGELVLPMRADQRDLLADIRSGLHEKAMVLEITANLEDALRQVLERCRLPEHSDRDSINAMLRAVYEAEWAA